ncbi:unnamed protein product [Owenia fusiformis]|uniref:Uncharacterized protein n=1 Tax=Owenia fusiformis TaxID=6347 RepID=A0A8J1XXW3_OWEFU|nr:unnamed protein product [Owenia fusiformis]
MSPPSSENYDEITESLIQTPLKQSFCDSLRRDTHWKCLILTVLIIGCLIAISWCRLTVVTKVEVQFYEYPIRQLNQASPCDDGYVYIPVAFVVMLYLVYLVECWHCHTRLELCYKVDVNAVYDRIQYMREAFPIIWWKAVCYHYVRRTRQVTRYRNGDAFTTTQVYYERINSHTAGSAFNFSNCGVKDMSRTLTNLEQYPATKIRFTKGFSFLCPEAETEFEDQRATFFQEHERRDDYMETKEGLDLLNVNFKEYMIAFADTDNLPWYVSHIIFWLASVFMLSWPLRVIIEYKTAYVHYNVHKVFGSNYLDPNYNPGHLSRVSTFGTNSDLEQYIRNNHTIVPSYSEALLMESEIPWTRSTHDANGNITPTSIPLQVFGAGAESNAPTSPNAPRTFIMGYIANGDVVYSNLSNRLPPSIPNGNPPRANGHLLNGSAVANGCIRTYGAFRITSDNRNTDGRQRRRKHKRHRKNKPRQRNVDNNDISNTEHHSQSQPNLAVTPEGVEGRGAMTDAPSGESTNETPTCDNTPIPTPAEEKPPPYEDALRMRTETLSDAAGESPSPESNNPSVIDESCDTETQWLEVQNENHMNTDRMLTRSLSDTDFTNHPCSATVIKETTL